MRKTLSPGGRRFAGVALFVMTATVGLSGCTALVGAGAGVGVAAVQERGIKGRTQDLRLEALVLNRFLNAGLKLTATIGVEVYEGRVMLTGATKDTKLSDEAVKLAWQVNGVVDVINEIKFDKNATATDFAEDAWITTQLKSNLTFDMGIMAINYVVETVKGTVYLIGIAQNQRELDRVIAHASAIKHVINVISHVRLKKKPFEARQVLRQ
ncbi:MAG: BON domain-containing protein [Rhodospirillales bacterium]|nr:BON domain-containing protein [Rhodospirillales bacterium]